MTIDELYELPDTALLTDKDLAGENGVFPFSIRTLWRNTERGLFERPIKYSPGISRWTAKQAKQFHRECISRSNAA